MSTAPTSVHLDALAEESLDLLRSAFSGSTFVAWVELWVGARTDPELAPAVQSMSDTFSLATQDLFRKMFRPAEYPDARFLEHSLAFAVAVMQGAALRSLVRPPDDTAVQVLKAVAGQLGQRKRDNVARR